jgi:hypothetical protein
MIYMIMNHPVFYVFTTPRTADCGKLWTPPDYECNFISKLAKNGFSCSVYSENSGHQWGTNGLAYLRDGSIIRLREDLIYDDYLCVQIYQEPLTDEELDCIKAYFISIMAAGFTPYTRLRRRIEDKGCLTPFIPQETQEFSVPVEKEFDMSHVTKDNPKLGDKWYKSFWSRNGYKFEGKKSTPIWEYK